MNNAVMTTAEMITNVITIAEMTTIVILITTKITNVMMAPDVTIEEEDVISEKDN